MLWTESLCIQCHQYCKAFLTTQDTCCVIFLENWKMSQDLVFITHSKAMSGWIGLTVTEELFSVSTASLDWANMNFVALLNATVGDLD